MDQDLLADQALVERLETLVNLNRIQILRALKTPRTLQEIVVRDEGEGAPIARQTVRRHLEILLAADVVRTREAKREFGETMEYVLNPQRLFSISEDLRQLARIRPSDLVEGRTAAEPAAPGAMAPRPCLLLVSGLEVGTAFDLRSEDPSREWIIGRRRGADVPLDFDAAVSAENAVVRRSGGEHEIEDLPGSRNGTRVNGALLGAGERRLLAHGDLVGVGRSLLLYWR